MTQTERTFEDHPAVRERVPVLLGIVGASGSGKTFSALRLATGMQRITGGDIFFIDTEGRRALDYADLFTFRHVPFGAPFGPLDYLKAIEHCVKRGATIGIVDSLSHEHEGPGGVLEQQEANLERLAGDDDAKRDRMNFAAWKKPKMDRARLLNTIGQLDINLICCFRAKDKIKFPPKGVEDRSMIELGWMPIAGKEIVYEFKLQALLYPTSDGVPEWNPTQPGEKMIVKIPGQFRELLKEPKQLDENIGEQVARWAMGNMEAPSVAEFDAVMVEIGHSTTTTLLNGVAIQQRRRPWEPEQRDAIRAAINEKKVVLEKAQGPCQHPDGFAPSSENPNAHCIHCGEEKDAAKSGGKKGAGAPEQQPLGTAQPRGNKRDL